MSWELSLADSHAVALGAGILGTGGGGNTYLGRLWLEREMQRLARGCRVIAAESLADDALTCAMGTMGAPTVGIEKLPHGNELVATLRALEEHIGRRFEAVVIGEIGGSNALRPLVCALQAGLPVVDGDGMGRAFPELQMDTFAIGGASLSPLALGDSHGNSVILHRVTSPKQAELYARNLTIEMGGSAALAMPVLSGRQLKRLLIRGTLTLARRLGEAVQECRRLGEDPTERVAKLGNGRVLFRGKISDVERRTTQGFARGRLTVTAFGAPREEMRIVFQNENLVAWQGERVVCTVPDLICILRLEDGEPVGTEMLRYGQRVAVIGLPAPAQLKSEEALAVVGPSAFGYQVPYHPLPGQLLSPPTPPA